MSYGSRIGLGLLVLALGTLGCASPTGGPEDLGREVRPSAPPEYDVLVFQQHLSEGRTAEAIAALRRAVAKDEESAYLHRLLGEYLARNNDLAGAVQHARRAHELAPDDVAARDLLAQLYAIENDVDSAEVLLRGADGEPLDLDSAIHLYRMYVQADQLPHARETAQWMVDHEPQDARSWVALQNAYRMLSMPEEAEKTLRRAIEIEPDNLRLYGILARSLRDRGDREGAIAVYRDVLERQPDHHATLIALADAQMAEEDLEGAIETFERIESGYPDDLQSATRLGFLLYDAGRFDEAVERFTRVLRVAPREYEIAFFLGLSLRRLQQEDDAIAVFESIPPHHDYYGKARVQISTIYERRGDYADALAEVERALEAESSRDLELYAATLRAKAGDFDGAVAYLEGLLEGGSGDDEVLYSLGVVYSESHRSDEALEYMQRALEVNPDNASALNFVGYTWAERGENLDEAEKLIARAIELRPDDGYIVDSLGWVYYMRARPLLEAGDTDAGNEWARRALQELERAGEMTGGDPVISEHMGDAYLLLGERRRALEMFEEASTLGPRPDEQPDLHEKLKALRRELE